MKKSKTMLCVLMATIFLLPLMGNTAMGTTYTYHFNSHDQNIKWATNPGYMVDGNESTYASTTIDGDVQLCDDNSYSGPPPSMAITKVEISVKAYTTGGFALRGNNVTLTPIFGGTTRGDDYVYELTSGDPGQWSQWFDITNDPAGPGANNWTWSDIDNLDMDVRAGLAVGGTLYCSMIKIQVTS